VHPSFVKEPEEPLLKIGSHADTKARIYPYSEFFYAKVLISSHLLSRVTPIRLATAKLMQASYRLLG
jgi:hypothetical protein